MFDLTHIRLKEMKILKKDADGVTVRVVLESTIHPETQRVFGGYLIEEN